MALSLYSVQKIEQQFIVITDVESLSFPIKINLSK